MKYVGSSFPSGPTRGDDFLHIPSGAIYEFVEGDPASSLSWKIVGGEMSSDPDITGWSTAQKGSRWYNLVDQQWKGWNGTDIVLIG